MARLDIFQVFFRLIPEEFRYPSDIDQGGLLLRESLKYSVEDVLFLKRL